MEKLNAEQLGYIAGLIDAECSIQIQQRKHRSVVKGKEYIYDGYSLCLDMSNTSKDLIFWLKDVIGGCWGRKKIYNPNHAPAFFWRLSGKPTQKLLSSIVHLLVVKRSHALNAMAFPVNHRKANSNLRQKLYQIQKELNRRGSKKLIAAETE